MWGILRAVEKRFGLDALALTKFAIDSYVTLLYIRSIIVEARLNLANNLRWFVFCRQMLNKISVCKSVYRLMIVATVLNVLDSCFHYYFLSKTDDICH